jgi:hypothetical protein
MFNLNLNGIKNDLNPIIFFNASINFFNRKKPTDYSVQIPTKPIKVKKEVFNDLKTTLSGSKVDIVENIKTNLTVYFFIEKESECGIRHSVVPVLLEDTTSEYYQFNSAYFDLQGSGTGLGKVDSLMYYLKKLMKRGYKAELAIRVVDNELLNRFRYIDSKVSLNYLIENSTPLIMYRKDDLKDIYNQYQELIKKHDL